ncbi:MAG: hypothetical protein WB952_12280 [Terriglobales bacterium]
MKIRKTVTDKVIAANRKNGEKGAGPRTLRGKDIVSQNATKHGILARNFRFKDDQEEAAYKSLIGQAKRSIDGDDPFQCMVAEVTVINYFRFGRALRLERKLIERKNPATELALGAIEHSELVSTGVGRLGFEPGWECTELHMSAKKDVEGLARNGPVAQSSGNGQELELHAKFQDPMDKALRYQRATARDFYRALDWLCKLRKEPQANSRN